MSKQEINEFEGYFPNVGKLSLLLTYKKALEITADKVLEEIDDRLF